MKQRRPTWRCPRCGEEVETQFDLCWNCGTGADGTPAEDFQAEANDPAVPDPGPDSDKPQETTAAPGPAGVRIVELCTAANAVEAEEFREALADEGLFAQVVGEVLSGSAGALTLGETTAPRIWVRAADADRAREILKQLAAQTATDPDVWPQPDSPPEWDTEAEPDDAITPGVPLPSDVKFRFLSQGFYIIGVLLMAIGAIWAYKTNLLLARYPAQTEGYWTGASGMVLHTMRMPKVDNLDLIRLDSFSFHWAQEKYPQYIYQVNGKQYLALGEKERMSDRMTIHYDPQRPERYLVGAVMPPWLLLALAVGLGAFSMFVGYQFR